MQQSKNSKRIEELKESFANSEDAPLTLLQTLDIFKVRRIGSFFNGVKRCGITVCDVLPTLILLPFYGISTISGLMGFGQSRIAGVKGGKDVYYALQNNEKINWRSLLYLISRRFTVITKQHEHLSTDGIRAMIFDDSPLKKTGKKTEYVGLLHDHVSGRYIFGYKILVCGYWDGASFYPIDFSLHREKGTAIEKVQDKLTRAKKKQNKLCGIKQKARTTLLKTKEAMKQARKVLSDKATKTASKQIRRLENKLERDRTVLKTAQSNANRQNKAICDLEKVLKHTKKKHPEYGLKPSERKAQHSKQRAEATPGAERAKEIDSKKTDNVIAMLKRAIRRGFAADYVLVDSWFCNLGLLEAVASLARKTKIHLVAMAKMGNTKYVHAIGGYQYNAHQLLTKYERKAITARSHKARYIKQPVLYGNIRVNLFFIKMGSCSKWHLLLTTDLSLNFQQLMDVYQIRWSIEVFFREAKQYLNLGKCKSNCFDAQIATATIVMTQYVLLSFHKRIHEPMTFDHIFAKLANQALEGYLASKLQKLFWVLVEVMGDIAGVDVIEFHESILREPQKIQKLKVLGIILTEEMGYKQAA
jgi:hypothetical protein